MEVGECKVGKRGRGIVVVVLGLGLNGSVWVRGEMRSEGWKKEEMLNEGVDVDGMEKDRGLGLGVH